MASSLYNVFYDFTDLPIDIACESEEFKNDEHLMNNFLKGCKWSPDGCSLLTNSEDRTIRVFGLSTGFFCDEDDSPKTLNISSRIPNGDLVYDFCWYPFISYPNTHCSIFACTSREHPIHLWDVGSGEANLLSTFSGINHLDELDSAHSLAFSMDGRKLYAGYKNSIKVFDFCRPGRQIEMKNTRSDKSLMGNGQSGIISCIAMCPTYPGVYVCGSYNKTLALYSDEMEGAQCVFQGHVGGITHVCYHPNGNYIYSGGRKDNEIMCWDMRNLGSVLHTFERSVDTNQRIYFDIDRNGKYLASGNCNGEISVWNLDDASLVTKIKSGKRCVNAVNFNPFLPLIASSSGQRDFHNFWIDDEICQPVSNINENCMQIWKAKVQIVERPVLSILEENLTNDDKETV